MEFINVFVLAVGILSLFTNGVLLYILVRDPLKCFKASTTYFIISLSLSDLLTGANACFWGLDEFFLSKEHQPYLLSLFWITTQASFLTLLAMSIERFLIVKYPIYCRVWITKRRVTLTIACIWSVSATLGGLILLPIPHHSYVQFSIFCEFFLSVFVMTALYTFILFGIRSSQETVKGTGRLHQGGTGQAIRETPSAGRKSSSGKKDTCTIQIIVTHEANSLLNRTLVPVSSGEATKTNEHRNGTTNKGALNEELLNGNKHPAGHNSREVAMDPEKSVEFHEESNYRSKLRRDFARATQNMIKKKEKTRTPQQDKLTVVVLLLVGILGLTVLPYLLASQISLGYTLFCQCNEPQLLTKFVNYYFPIELLNFAVNPLVYAWRLPQYRRSLRYLFTKQQPQSEASQGWASFRSASFKTRRDYNSQ